MPTIDTYRRLAPDHPVWQERHPTTALPRMGPALPGGAPTVLDRATAPPHVGDRATVAHRVDLGDEDGSLITEYGLLAIVAATVAAAVISWASDGAMASLFGSLLEQARGIVGA
jgi:Flp pilus assembly pilin Flp